MEGDQHQLATYQAELASAQQTLVELKAIGTATPTTALGTATTESRDLQPNKNWWDTK
jgi:hypothetical protein